MPRNFSLFAQTKLNSEQLAYAQALIKLQSQVQQLFNTLSNVYAEVCHTTPLSPLGSRALFRTGFREAPEPNAQPTPPITSG